MNAKVLPEIALDIEANIKRLIFTCPICIEDFGEEKLIYNNQCTSGKHYLCNDCNDKYIKNCNKNRKDHICVICKEVIKVYEESIVVNNVEEEVRAGINIQHVNQNNGSIPFILKLLVFDSFFVIITLFIMGNMKISKEIKNSIYTVYGFLLFSTLLVCCVTKNNCRILS